MKIIIKLLWVLALTLLLPKLNCAAIEIATADGLMNCTTLNTTNECPANSICSIEVIANNTDAYRCKCLVNYMLNLKYKSNVTASNNNNQSNASNDTNITNSYCLLNATSQTGNRIYVRQPAKVEHLAFGVLLVLFVVIAVVALLYLLKMSRPIKRSKAAYTRLKRRRELRQRLEEFNEDDISMIQLNEQSNQKR